MKIGSAALLCRLVKAAAWFCLACQFTWAAAYLLAGSSPLRLISPTPPFLSLANWLAIYLFIPLPVVLLTAVLCRARRLLIGSLAAGCVFLVLWSWQFSPARWIANHAENQKPEPSTLKVMTYNILAWHSHTDRIIGTIQHENADVVFLQELNPEMAQALREKLSREYPYQLLNPRKEDPNGSGFLSKYPLEPIRVDLPHPNWVGEPLAANMQWRGRQVLLITFHMASSTRFTSWQAMAEDFTARDQQANLLAAFAGSPPHAPSGVIMAGDMNSVPLSDAYQVMTSTFQDAWAQAGFGLGHTFPGDNINDAPKPHIGPFIIPSWILRLDYIFYTPSWRCITIHTAQIDGVSDHRGVVAELEIPALTDR